MLTSIETQAPPEDKSRPDEDVETITESKNNEGGGEPGPDTQAKQDESSQPSGHPQMMQNPMAFGMNPAMLQNMPWAGPQGFMPNPMAAFANTMGT